MAGLMARVGIDQDLDSPTSLMMAIDVLDAEGISIHEKAKEKWAVLSRLSGQVDT